VTYKKGDILSITFRNGYDAEGKPVMLTLERAEVLGCSGGRLQVTYRDVNRQHDDVEIDGIAFDISMSDVLMKQCGIS
jgi:hypothetical protein